METERPAETSAVETPKLVVPATPLVVKTLVPRLDIRTPSQGPTAMEARFTCQTCGDSTIVKIPWNATSAQRSMKMKEALDLHRVLCPIGVPEDQRVYDIHYPR